jgi:hypothetical protein
MKLFVVFFLLCLPAMAADPIPQSRRINWSQAGLPGGIPAVSTVCATIAAGASQASIQAALDSCPANQAVVLAAGTYDVNGTLTVPSGVVLRGSGPQQTVLNASGSGQGFIRLGSGTTPNTSNSTAITSGATKGSTSISVSSATGISVGTYLLITQLNDPSFVTITTSNGTCTWCDGSIGWNGTRVMGQIVEVTSVAGTSIGFSPGLYADYTLTPLATRFAMSARYAGVEDLQVYMNNTGFTANFYARGAAYSWIKNVESNYADGDHVQLHWGYRNEIRDSYFHDGWIHTPGQTDDCLFVANKTSATLVENNTLRRLHVSVMLNWGAAGNVIAYNYMDNNFDSGGSTSVMDGADTHGAHPMFNLWEGNIGPVLDNDYYWGSSSHNTAFRNWWKGVQLVIPPLTGRGAEQPGSATWAIYGLRAVDMSQTVRYVNLLGNIIGSDRQKAVGTWTPLAVAPQSRSFYSSNHHYGYTFGYANLSDSGTDSGDNGLPYSTALIHGDYDYVLGSFRWDAGTADHDLSASLYRSTRPGWFGTLAWPAFGPSLSDANTAVIGELPAKKCFDQGRMPTCLSDARDFYAVTPCRALDSRQAAGPFGGLPLVSGTGRTLALASVCGIPATASAVSLNVTVTEPTADGNVRLYPGGTPTPLVSTVNFRAGQTRANNAIAVLGAGGDLTLYAAQAAPAATVHVIIDVNGYFE